MPRVSVLLTSYNHERYIRECVDSALSQTFADLEVIVIDDGSQDRSVEILRSYGDRIRLVVNDPNRGTYGVLNQGLNLATGEYSAVLNSDDVWLPTKIARQVELMDANPQMTFCHTFGEFIDGNGSVVTGTPMGFEFPRTPTGDVLHIFIANNTAIASSVLMRTQIARDIGGFDASYKNLGDWDMWVRLGEQGAIGFVDDRLTLYRVHGANTIYQIETTRSEEMRLRSDLYARREQFLAKRNTPKVRAALAHTIACLGSLHSITGNPKRARQLYIESLRMNPKRMKSLIRWFMTFLPLSLRKRTL